MKKQPFEYKGIEYSAIMLSRDHIAETAATFTGTEKFRIAQAAIAKVDAPSILIEPTRLAAMASPHFSHTLADELKATSQGSSGRCWIFAALNVLRYDLAKTHSLPADFELSQTYVYFYDKLERVNYFLEQCIALKDEAVDSRLFQHILTSPLGDSGICWRTSWPSMESCQSLLLVRLSPPRRAAG